MARWLVSVCGLALAAPVASAAMLDTKNDLDACRASDPFAHKLWRHYGEWATNYGCAVHDE